ncbi:hypothetical protein Acr_05g0013170 [Actinidia rufa]|uniref:Uncharacterized protein n=1 Tax=Actinidia rufa TaxID=165716 RepID=A0A7J0EMH7_9ERIC|nr:hypothetical protein Acr_05g0013170 [Actinidia rufa]
MSSCQARGHARSLRRTCEDHGACENSEEGDGENHQESMIRGGANTLGGNVRGVGGAPPTTFASAEFMQGVKNTV